MKLQKEKKKQFSLLSWHERRRECENIYRVRERMNDGGKERRIQGGRVKREAS